MVRHATLTHLCSVVPAPASASVIDVPDGFQLETGTDAVRRQTLVRLRDALEEATAAHAAGTAWIYMPDVPGEARTPDGHPTMWSGREPVSFEGRSGITGDGRKGGLYLSVRPAACNAGESCSPALECSDVDSWADRAVPACAEGLTRAGLKAIDWVDEPPPVDGKQYVTNCAQVVLGGGGWTLTLRAVNYFGGDASPVSAPAPVLSRTQLAAIAGSMADQIRP